MDSITPIYSPVTGNVLRRQTPIGGRNFYLRNCFLCLQIRSGVDGLGVRCAAVDSSPSADASGRWSAISPTHAVPLLSYTEVIDRFKENQQNRHSKQQFLAMYSSIFGGITTDPAVMVIPLDDHMVHRGHGVFDTATIVDGFLYELDPHLDRFLKSATMARITLPFDLPTVRSILIQTVGASKCRNGSLRYWVSSGPGDFLLSPSNRDNSALYAIVIQDQSVSNQNGVPNQKGVKVVTSTIPLKSRRFAIMKSVNYMPNVLSKIEAEDQDAFASIWLDDEGFVAEGPNMNVAFVTQDKELLMPHFDKILSGCTAKRILVLAEKLVKDGTLRGIRLANITVQEGKVASEMMLLGSGTLVRSVTLWDEQVIGNGREGPVASELLNLLLEDMKDSPLSSVRIPIPY